LEFHNVAALEPVEGFSGVRMQRFPRDVRPMGWKRGGLFVSRSADRVRDSGLVTEAPVVQRDGFICG